MEWLTKLKEMKKVSGKTSKEISDATGIPKSTVDKLFSGQTKEPYLSSTRAIVHFLGFTLDDLLEPSKLNEFSQTEINHIKKYRALDERGKKMVDLVLNEEYEQSQKPVHILQAVARDGRIAENTFTQAEVDEIGEMIKTPHSDFHE